MILPKRALNLLHSSMACCTTLSDRGFWRLFIQHAPGKTFKSLYKSLFRERLGSLARNEIASYPAIKIVERLGKEDLQHAVEQVCPLVGSLVERSRTAVIKVLIERCHIREVDTQAYIHGDSRYLW